MAGKDIKLWLDTGQLRFKAPKGALTSELRAQLKDRKQELIAFLDEQTSGSATPPLAPAGREGPIPLSFTQQRIWFINRFQPETPVYNCPFAYRLRGPVAAVPLERALSTLIHRHEALRTRFPDRGGKPYQQIEAPWRANIEVCDWRNLKETEALSFTVLSQAGLIPFDLTRLPLFRVRLCRISEFEHILFLLVHHIIWDEWSLNLFLDQWQELYLRSLSGNPLNPDPALQFADFAIWQRDWLRGETLTRQLDFWRGYLKGSPTVSEFPTDRPRPKAASHRGAVCEVLMPRGLSRQLKDLANRHGATLFMTLLAVFKLTIAKYSGQSDVVTGTPVANRHHAGCEDILGFFSNTLILRASLQGNPTVAEWIGRVKQAALAAFAHQDLPFEALVEDLAPERDLSRNPLFQIMFSYHAVAEREARLGAASMRVWDLDYHVAHFDITLGMLETRDGLIACFSYATDLFQPSTAARLARHLPRIAARMAADSRLRIGDIELLTAEDRHQMIREWNWNKCALPEDRTVHGVFSAQVGGRPDAAALVYKRRIVTYAALAARTEPMRANLRKHGLTFGMPVAVLCERAPDMPAAYLAILQCGGTYLPLDPNNPASRIHYMLEDAATPLLVSGGNVPKKWEGFQGTVVPLETLARVSPAKDREPEAPVAEASGTLMAYIMYTSGSTGKAKGVCIPHRGVVRLAWNNRAAPFGPKDRGLQISAVSFDASTMEFWGNLLNGACLVLFPKNSPDLALIGRYMERHRLTTVFLTTALFQQMVVHHLPEMNQVKVVITGGDVMPVSQARALLQTHPGIVLGNAYGPTENTTDTTVLFMARSAEVLDSVPIGRPIDNTDVYLADRYLRPVPTGVTGELLTGGPGLAWGYLRLPAKTAEVFVPNGFSGIPGDRLYRTGDLARYLPDGNVAFLGRRDFQIKLRGFRVEPGEIETVLAGHPRVRHALVMLREDRPGDKWLVGYVEPGPETEDGELDASVLRDYLMQSLPEYMVPSAFVIMREWPVSSHDKIDRKALPAPAMSRDGAGDDFVAPRNELESEVAEIWSDLLQIPEIGINDNFFLLGGHSLLVTQLVSRIRGKTGVALTLKLVFEKPTVAELAEVIAGKQSPQTAKLPPIPTQDRDGDFPLSLAQQRLWFIDRISPNRVPYNIPLALDLSGPFDFCAFRNAMDDLVRRHETLRTVFLSREGIPRQRIEDPEPVAVATVDLSGLPGSVNEAETRRMVDGEALKPFNLTEGPLIRVALLIRGPHHVFLLLTLHHIVSDGWSLGVLQRELSLLYNGYSRNRKAKLPPLSIQYVDYAAWQRSVFQGESLDAQVSYWKSRLGGTLPVMATDKPRPAIPDLRCSQRFFSIPLETSKRAEQFTKEENATTFMLLMTAFRVLLRLYSGQEDSVIGTAVANRSVAQTESLIGFFVNTLALRGRVPDSATFRSLLFRERERTLEALANQDVPYDRLVEVLKPDRDANHNPIFQVMFTFQNLPKGDLAFRGLNAVPWNADVAGNMFDLTLAMTMTEEGLVGVWIYNTSLFYPETVEGFVAFFRELLAAAGGPGEVEIGRLNLRIPEPELPVEETVESTPKHSHPSREGAVSIGKPATNARVYVLDSHGNLVPTGYPGELVIAGAGLARGYLGRATTTAVSFVPDPYSRQLGDRIYRTGDLACRGKNGVIDYLGRIDHQIKVRGFRVELGEIEALLSAHPGVAKAAVIADTSRGHAPRLVAFIEEEKSGATKRGLKGFLARSLPEFMIPAAIVALDKIPITASRKIDRGCLKRMAATDAATDPAGDDRALQFLAPRSRVERELTLIWQELLATEPIGIRDNFFELGGHSLLSLRLLARIEKSFGIHLSVAVLFKNPTVADLAKALEHEGAGTPGPLVCLQPKGTGMPLFLVHAVGGGAMHLTGLADRFKGVRPVYALESQGLDGTGEPLTSIAAMAETYLRAIVEIVRENRFLLGGWSLGGIVALEMAGQLRARDRAVGPVMLLDSWATICDTHYDETKIAGDFLFDLCAQAGKEPPEEAAALLHRNPEQIREAVMKALTGAGILTHEDERPRFEALYRVFRANMRAAGNYVPPPYDGPAYLFRAEGDPGEDRDAAIQIESWNSRGIHPEVFDIPGGHYSFLLPPNAEILAERMESCLTRWGGGERFNPDL